jgi:hypothetical protein
MKLSGGDVDVTAGTGFRKGEPSALVRLTVFSHDDPDKVVALWIRPLEARAIGLDLIGAAHASMADTVLRAIAQGHGLDGDGLIAMLRAVTDEELGPG